MGRPCLFLVVLEFLYSNADKFLRKFVLHALLLSLPAHALFLAGQAGQGGEIAILCEGQGTVFVSLPTGEVRAVSLDAGGQARFYPRSQGPHTVQCGREAKTVAVLMPPPQDSGAYSGGEIPALAAGAAIAFIAILFIAAKRISSPRTEFSKSAANGQVSLRLRAGCDLRGITICDPQGGEGGAPIELSIPRLPAGAAWEWAYEQTPGAPLLPARLSAKCAKGEICLVSCADSAGACKKVAAVRRALPRSAN
ncbi:MAG: hypothetical protein WC717_03715 [Candidatus Micrarchaeia archaeon]